MVIRAGLPVPHHLASRPSAIPRARAVALAATDAVAVAWAIGAVTDPVAGAVGAVTVALALAIRTVTDAGAGPVAGPVAFAGQPDRGHSEDQQCYKCRQNNTSHGALLTTVQHTAALGHTLCAAVEVILQAGDQIFANTALWGNKGLWHGE